MCSQTNWRVILELCFLLHMMCEKHNLTKCADAAKEHHTINPIQFWPMSALIHKNFVPEIIDVCISRFQWQG